MKNLNINILKELCLTPGISGVEKESGIIDVIYSLVKSVNANTIIDDRGNIISKIENGKKKILIDTHMDEVGFIIKAKISDRKFLLGLIGKINISLVDGIRLYNLKLSEIGTTLVEENELFILLNEDVEVLIGDYLSFKRSFDYDGKTVTALALDNRIGCFAAINLISYFVVNPLRGSSITFVFSQGEETENTNLLEIAQKENTDFGIVIDAAYAQPWDSKNASAVIPILGEGAAIQHQGENFIVDINLIERIEMLAINKKIAYQSEIPDISEGKTNFEFLQKGLIPGCVINIPTRNQHQASSIANAFDIQNAIKLLKEILFAYDSDSLS